MAAVTHAASGSSQAALGVDQEHAGRDDLFSRGNSAEHLDPFREAFAKRNVSRFEQARWRSNEDMLRLPGIHHGITRDR